MSSINPCVVCGNNADHKISDFCSNHCQLAFEATVGFCKEIANYQSDDQRIFFYDFAFGDLCDLWSTYLIRRVRSKDLNKSRQVDRALERLEKAILTKLNRYVVTPGSATRRDILELVSNLVSSNAHIWEWKEKHWNEPEFEKTGVPGEDWIRLKKAYAKRDSCRQQLDRLVERGTMTEKSYDR